MSTRHKLLHGMELQVAALREALNAEHAEIASTIRTHRMLFGACARLLKHLRGYADDKRWASAGQEDCARIDDLLAQLYKRFGADVDKAFAPLLAPRAIDGVRVVGGNVVVMSERLILVCTARSPEQEAWRAFHRPLMGGRGRTWLCHGPYPSLNAARASWEDHA